MHSGYVLRATTFFPSDAPGRAIPMSQRLTVDRLSETPNTMVALRWMLGKWKHSGNGLKWKVQTMEICFSSLAVLVSLTECSVKSSLATRLAKYATTRSFSLPFRRIGGASHLTALSKTRYACIRHRLGAHSGRHTNGWSVLTAFCVAWKGCNLLSFAPLWCATVLNLPASALACCVLARSS